MIDPRLLFGLLAGSAGVLGLWAARERRRARGRAGSSVVAVDVDTVGAPLRSTSWGLVGRPDEILRLADGRRIPVEVKSRSAPRRGVPPSHRLQLYAYLALLEDQPGGSPPYGVLRYGDGTEFPVAWNGAARAELTATIAEARRPYDGRARPGPDKCPRCPWFEGCDARWTGDTT